MLLGHTSPPASVCSRAYRLPSVSLTIDHHPNGCWTGGWGKSTPRALSSSKVARRSSQRNITFEVGKLSWARYGLAPPVRRLSTRFTPSGARTSIHRSSPYRASWASSNPALSVQNSLARSWSSTSMTTLLTPAITATSSLGSYSRFGYIRHGYILTGLYTGRVSVVNSVPSLTQAGFLVLLALASGEAHGYAVMRFVEETTGGRVRLPPGTLYRTISRLVADGLVEGIEGEDPDAPHDARRRYYRLTERGRQAAKDEAELLDGLTAAAVRAGLVGKRRGE